MPVLFPYTGQYVIQGKEGACGIHAGFIPQRPAASHEAQGRAGIMVMTIT